MTPEGTADGPDVAALSEDERNALDAADEQHDYPTETDDGLVMRCGCGATPPGHLLGQQVDEGLWLWRHRRNERMAAVERILADRLAAVTEQRDQYAARVARVEAVLESNAYAQFTVAAPEMAGIFTPPLVIRVDRIRAALRADGGGGE